MLALFCGPPLGPLERKTRRKLTRSLHGRRGSPGRGETPMPDDAASVVGEALASISDPLPDLVVYGGDLPATVRALCRLIAENGKFYDRGGVSVLLVKPSDGGPS